MMDKKKEHTEDCGPNGCSSYCESDKDLCCGHHNDEHISMVEYTAEQKAVVETLYNELLAAIEKTRKDGVIDVPMVVMPFAAILANMFSLVESQGGESCDHLTIAFAKLIKYNTDINRVALDRSMGHA